LVLQSIGAGTRCVLYSLDSGTQLVGYWYLMGTILDGYWYSKVDVLNIADIPWIIYKVLMNTELTLQKGTKIKFPMDTNKCVILQTCVNGF
jgi:hypothetical protein